jgi:hypothetical protein
MSELQLTAIFFGVIIAISFICGCVEPATPQQTVAATVATVIPTTVTATPRPTICHMEQDNVMVCLYTDLTSVATTIPTTTVPGTTSPWVCTREGDGPEICLLADQIAAAEASAPEPTGPLAAPVTLNGFGSQIVWFEAVRPGDVTLKIRPYSVPEMVKNCEVTKSSIMLAGKSIDQNIPMGVGLGGFTRTATLPLVGRYSLTVKSCYTWQITVS